MDVGQLSGFLLPDTGFGFLVFSRFWIGFFLGSGFLVFSTWILNSYVNLYTSTPLCNLRLPKGLF